MSKPATAARVAAVFPGQGAQRPGMGAIWKDTPEWSIAERISDWTGYDIPDLLLNADEEHLRRTDIAQLSIFTVSLMGLTHLRGTGFPDIQAYAGHSVGEYTALVAAGALGMRDGARLVARRGAAMRAAARSGPGTMAVLVADLDAVSSLVAEVDSAVWVANVNDPRQIVVSGTTAAVGAVVEAAGRENVRTVHIGVAGAFHTPLMVAAVPALRRAVEQTEFADSHAPVVSNVDGSTHHGEQWREILIRQLTAPVRWQACVTWLVGTGRCDTTVEVGPRRTLTGTIRRSGLTAKTYYVGSPGDSARLPFG